MRLNVVSYPTALWWVLFVGPRGEGSRVLRVSSDLRVHREKAQNVLFELMR